MSTTACPSWCDREHPNFDQLEDQPHGSVRHAASVRVADETGSTDSYGEIEETVTWRTDATGRRLLTVETPGITLDPYFTEVYLDRSGLDLLRRTLHRAEELLELAAHA